MLACPEVERDTDRQSVRPTEIRLWPEASALIASALQLAMLMPACPLVSRLTAVAVREPRWTPA